MQIGEYSLTNEEKLDRTLHGTLGREGKLYGGVGDEASEDVILAEYDRLGGLVTKNGIKVRMGSFYDFDKRQPRKEPVVSFMTEVDGEILEVSEDEAVVLRAAKEKTEAIKAKKLKKVKATEDEDEEEEEKPKKLKRKRTE